MSAGDDKLAADCAASLAGVRALAAVQDAMDLEAFIESELARLRADMESREP